MEYYIFAVFSKLQVFCIITIGFIVFDCSTVWLASGVQKTLRNDFVHNSALFSKISTSNYLMDLAKLHEIKKSIILPTLYLFSILTIKYAFPLFIYL